MQAAGLQTEEAQTSDLQKTAENILIKNGVFWDVTPRGSYKSRRFGGT
jgi:hypothetical protein